MSDGGAAIVFASEEGVRKSGCRIEDCIELVGNDTGAGNLWDDPIDLTKMDTTKSVVDRLYAKTGLSIKDMDVAEIHDCFTMAELMMYEAIGLSKAGESVFAIREGKTNINSELPVNTGGGLVSFGHPVGATGIK